MNRIFIFLAVFLSMISTQNVLCQDEEVVDLSKIFKDSKGSFVLYDYNSNKYTRYNPDLAAERFTPASTYKILNSLIGLETGAVKDENEILKWNGTEYLVMKDWNRDHDLTSAIKYSVVWFYKELARRIGEEKMREYVNKVGYGNGDISGGIDRFWLGSSMKISADEQVEFLKKFNENNLPFSQPTIDVVKAILPGEDGDGWKLRAKTGLSNIAENYFIGWYAGYVYTGDNTYVFALNLFGDDVDAIRTGRIEMAKEILKHLGIVR